VTGSEEGGPRTVAFEVSTLLTESPTGVWTYGEGLMAALRALRPDRSHTQIHRWGRVRLRNRRPLSDRADIPIRGYWNGARLDRRFDLVHALDTRLPSAYRGPLVATLFDVISALPEAAERAWSSTDFREKKRRAYRRIAERADLTIAVSNATKGQFLNLERPRGPVLTIPPGISGEFLASGRRRDHEDVLRRLELPPRYLLSVGALCPRKNIEAIAAAFRRARERDRKLGLVLVGEPASEWTGTPGCREVGLLGNAVRLLGRLARKDLASVYVGAEALLYLSHYEGWGLPVVEAMACGAPVIASRRGGIPEAAGDAALLVDPDSPAEIDAAIGALCSSTEPGERLRGQLESQGRERAARLTWESSARQVDDAYRQALEHHARSASRNRA